MTDSATQTEEQRQADAAEAAAAYRAKFAGQEEPPPAAEPPAAEAPVKPDHVPEKFWNKEDGTVNYEAWNKAHSELESRFHQAPKADESATPASEEKPAADKDAEGGDPPEPPAALMERPSVQAAQAAYEANRSLTAAEYTALEADGISRDMVDNYIAGQEAKASALTTAAYTPAGGEEGYNAMIGWAAENLSEGEKKAFNTQMGTGDPEVVSTAVSALFARYSETATVDAERTGGGAPSTNSTTFESRAEMTAAINKLDTNGRRLYDVDSAYRNEIARKIGATRKAGKVF